MLQLFTHFGWCLFQCFCVLLISISTVTSNVFLLFIGFHFTVLADSAHKAHQQASQKNGIEFLQTCGHANIALIYFLAGPLFNGMLLLLAYSLMTFFCFLTFFCSNETILSCWMTICFLMHRWRNQVERAFVRLGIYLLPPIWPNVRPFKHSCSVQTNRTLVFFCPECHTLGRSIDELKCQ